MSMQRRDFLKYTAATGAAVLLAIPTPALAYMGAGAGLSAIGSILSFVGVFALMLFGFVWYPIKRRFKKNQGEGDVQLEAQAEAEAEPKPE